METITVTSPNTHVERCETCDAPVDREQRYCVSCGTHRRLVADPAARYLALASARARAARAGARPGAGRRRNQAPSSLLTALVLAVIPVAVAIGVLVGHSGSLSQKQIKELSAIHTPTITQDVAAGNSGTTGTTATTKGHTKKHHGSAAKSASSKTSPGKVVAKTKYGTATAITGSHASKAQQQQGEADAHKVQNAKGKGYVDTQSSLPSTVVIP